MLLCVLVLAAGLELVGVGESLNTARSRDLRGEGGKGGEVEVEEGKRRWMVMFVTVAGILVRIFGVQISSFELNIESRDMS